MEMEEEHSADGAVAAEAVSSVMEKRIMIRLEDRTVGMIDRGVETGFGKNRSDVVRRLLLLFQNMGSSAGEQVAFFIAHVLSEPLEYAIWLRDRALLMAEGDEFRKREAGIVTLLVKEAALRAGTLDEMNLEEIRERVFRTISCFEGFGITAEAQMETPLPEGPSVAGAFDVLISHLTERIKSGANAEEVADMLEVMIVLAGTYDYYNATGVHGALALMAQASDVQDICPGREAEMNFDLFESGYENFYLVVPALCDNLPLRKEVRLCLLRDLLCFTGLPVEEAELLLLQRVSDLEDADEGEE